MSEDRDNEKETGRFKGMSGREVVNSLKKTLFQTQDITQPYLLFFEPSEQDFIDYPFLRNLGGILKHERHPVLVHYCTVYNVWRMAQVALEDIDECISQCKWDHQALKEAQTMHKLVSSKVEEAKAALEAIKKQPSFMREMIPGGVLFDSEEKLKLTPEENFARVYTAVNDLVPVDENDKENQVDTVD